MVDIIYTCIPNHEWLQYQPFILLLY